MVTCRRVKRRKQKADCYKLASFVKVFRKLSRYGTGGLGPSLALDH